MQWQTQATVTTLDSGDIVKGLQVAVRTVRVAHFDSAVETIIRAKLTRILDYLNAQLALEFKAFDL